MPSLTVLFADAIAASGSGSVDVESNAVVNDASGNVFVVGSFTGTVDFDPSATTLNLTASGGRDLFLARFTSAGSLSWVKKLPGSNSSAVALGEAITLDASGNILIAGTFTGSVNFDPAGANAGATFNAGTRNDIFLARYDGNGSLSWARDLVGGVNLSAHGYALATDASGNITLAGSFQTALTVGTTTLSGAGTTDGFVARANSAGQFAWAVATNGAGTSQVQTTGVSLDGSGNVLTTGFIAGTADFQPGAGATNLASNGGSRDIFVQKLDGNGGFVWAVAIGSPDIDQGNAIKADAAGNVYVTGTFSMSADFDPGAGTTTLTAGGFDDPFLLKLTPSGGLSWARRFALSGFNFGHGTGVGLDASNHVFVTGYYQGTMVVDAVSSASITSAGGFDVFLVEYDTSGNYVASQSFGGANFDAAFGVGVNASGQVALAGRFSGPAAFGSINLPAQSGKSIFVTQIATTILQAPPPAPAAPVLQAASDTGSSNSDRVTSRTSLTFDLSGASAPGNVLELLRDGVVVASRTGDGPITDPGPVSDGTRTYTARQTNASSQVSPISASTTVVIDTQAPGTPSVLVLVTADDSSTKGDGITNVRLPRFTGTGPASTLIQLIDAGGNVVGSTTSAADGSFTLTPALNLADGSYGFRARAVDLAGNVGTAGTALALVIDATAPATAPAPAILAADDTGTLGDNLTSKRQPRLVGTVEALATVRLLNGSGSVLATTTALASGTYTISPTSLLPEGANTLRIEVVDAAGNVSAQGSALTLTIDATAPTTPAAPSLLAADDSGASGDRLTNVRQPRLSGTTEANAIVQLLNGSGQVIGTTTAAANGSYTVSPSSALADGIASLAVQAIDAAGNASPAGATLSITIDATAPATPAAPTLLSADDSGTAGDSITNIRQPRLTGTVEANATVQLLNGAGTVIGTTSAGANGSYTLSPASPLADGATSLRIQAIDAAGNSSAAGAALSITIDATAPATPATPTLLAADDSGTMGDGITSVRQPRLTGSAEANATIQLLDGSNAILATATAGANGSYSLSPGSALAEGLASLRVRAIDAAGNVGATSPVLTLTIDATAPATPASPTLLAADDSGTTGDRLTNIRQPRFTGTVEGSATVQLLDENGTVRGTATANAGGSYTISPASPLAEGSGALRVRAIDAAGNVGVASSLVTFTIDATAPATPSTPTILLADDSGVVGDGITNVKQPRLTGTVEAGATVQLLTVGGTLLGTATAGLDGTYNVSPSSPLADGITSVRVQAFDAAGNLSPVSGILSLTIDTSVHTTPTTPSLLTADDTGTKDDATTSVRQPRLTGLSQAGLTIRLLNSVGTVIGTTVVNAAGAYTVSPSSLLAEGVHTLRVVAVDGAGNLSPTSASYTLTIDATAPATPAAPTLLAADDSGTAGDRLTSVRQPRFTGTAEASATILLVDAAGNVLGTTTAGAGGAYTVSPSAALADGGFTLKVQAVDVAGNASAFSSTISLTIDATPPAAPTTPTLLAADDSGIAGDGVTNVNLPRLTGTAEPGTALRLLNASGTILGTATASGTGSYSISPSTALAEGTLAVRVQAIDAAGNLGPASDALNLVIDRTAPATASALVLLAADDSGTAGDGRTSVRQPRFTGTAEAGATVQLLNGAGIVIGTATSAGNGAFTISPSSALANGTYTLQARAVDLAGNVGPNGSSLSITIDATAPSAPSVPSILPADDSGLLGDNVTSVRRPHLIGTAEVGSLVELIDGSNVVVGFATAGLDGRYSIQPASSLSDGSYSFRARATDAAGNVGSASTALGFMIFTPPSIPATPSVPQLVPADDTGIAGDSLTANTRPRFSGTATAGMTVQLLDATSTVIGSATAAADGSYTVSVSTSLGDGLLSVRARVQDLSGNLSALSDATTLTIDATAPGTPAAPSLLAADDSGAAGDGITNVRQPRFDGIAEPGATVQLLDVVGNVLATATAAADGSVRLSPASPLADGGYGLSLRAIDAAGNVSGVGSARPLTIDATPPAPAGLVYLHGGDDSGTVGDGVTNNRQPRLVGPAPAGVTVQIVDASGNVLGSALSVSGGYTIRPTSPLADGLYWLRTRAVDAAGNLSSLSTAAPLAIMGNTPATPAAPRLLAADDSGAIGDNKTSIRRPRFVGTAAGTSLDLVDSTGTVIGTATVAANGTYTVQPSAAFSGSSASVRVRVRDLAGNASGFSDPLTISFGTNANVDLDGDGKTDVGIHRPATAQYISKLSAGGGFLTTFGQTNLTDIPVPADYDGNGTADVAVFRPATGQWILNLPTGVRVIAFGAAGLFDIPVAGDYDGDGAAEPGVFRPSTGQWFAYRPTGGWLVATFGATNLTDIPVPADFDGDGKTDPAVFRTSTAQWLAYGPSGEWQVGTFGATGLFDIPIPGDYDGTGKAQMAVYRPSTGQWFVMGASSGRLLDTFGALNLYDYPMTAPFGSLKKLGRAGSIRISSVPTLKAASLEVSGASPIVADAAPVSSTTPAATTARSLTATSAATRTRPAQASAVDAAIASLTASSSRSRFARRAFRS